MDVRWQPTASSVVIELLGIPVSESAHCTMIMLRRDSVKNILPILSIDVKLTVLTQKPLHKPLRVKRRKVFSLLPRAYEQHRQVQLVPDSEHHAALG